MHEDDDDSGEEEGQRYWIPLQLKPAKFTMISKWKFPILQGFLEIVIYPWKYSIFSIEH